jgi:hypothetical protein
VHVARSIAFQIAALSTGVMPNSAAGGILAILRTHFVSMVTTRSRLVVKNIVLLASTERFATLGTKETAAHQSLSSGLRLHVSCAPTSVTDLCTENTLLRRRSCCDAATGPNRYPRGLGRTRLASLRGRLGSIPRARACVRHVRSPHSATTSAYVGRKPCVGIRSPAVATPLFVKRLGCVPGEAMERQASFRGGCELAEIHRGRPSSGRPIGLSAAGATLGLARCSSRPTAVWATRAIVVSSYNQTSGFKPGRPRMPHSDRLLA